MKIFNIRHRLCAGLLLSAVLVPVVNASCGSEEKRLISKYTEKMQRFQNQQLGMCQIARITADMAREMMDFYSRCPSADPNGQMMTSMRQQLDWARQTRSQACN